MASRRESLPGVNLDRRPAQRAEAGGARREDLVTVEIKGQADVSPGTTMDLAIEGGRFHVFGPDEKVLRHARYPAE